MPLVVPSPSPVQPGPSRRDRIVEAATGVFRRYGYARTTLGDIALAAGLSRPALYQTFPGKDEIFTAVIEHLTATTLASFREAVTTLPSLAEQLHLCCERWGDDGYDLIHTHPDARDLFDLRFPAVQQMYADFQAFLAGLIAAAAPAPTLSPSPAQLARVLVFAMRGFRDTVSSRDDMHAIVALQVDLVLAALAQAAPAPQPPASPRARRPPR